MGFSTENINIDENEINKFAKLADKWWDKTGDFKTLHDINPLRLDYIIKNVIDIKNKSVLDIGCGGGILSEAMASKGAKVKAIDMADASLEVAKLHLKKSKFKIDYQKTTVEDLARNSNKKYDIIACLEILEHVPDPHSIIQSAAKLLKSNGSIFFSTINRNLKSYLFAIIAAEYVLNLLPKGTHEHSKFIKPSELDNYARDAGLKLKDIVGITYNPIADSYKLENDVSVNYLTHYALGD